MFNYITNTLWGINRDGKPKSGIEIEILKGWYVKEIDNTIMYDLNINVSSEQIETYSHYNFSEENIKNIIQLIDSSNIDYNFNKLKNTLVKGFKLEQEEDIEVLDKILDIAKKYLFSDNNIMENLMDDNILLEIFEELSSISNVNLTNEQITYLNNFIKKNIKLIYESKNPNSDFNQTCNTIKSGIREIIKIISTKNTFKNDDEINSMIENIYKFIENGNRIIDNTKLTYPGNFKSVFYKRPENKLITLANLNDEATNGLYFNEFHIKKEYVEQFKQMLIKALNEKIDDPILPSNSSNLQVFNPPVSIKETFPLF